MRAVLVPPVCRCCCWREWDSHLKQPQASGYQPHCQPMENLKLVENDGTVLTSRDMLLNRFVNIEWVHWRR